MQTSRTFLLALFAAALAGAGGVRAHEFPVQQDSDIQASGHDPEWTLEISGAGRLVLTLDGQSGSYTLPKYAPTIYRDQLKVVYRVPNDQHALTVFVKGEACRDTVTGKSHEVSVLVSYDGKGYAGCGDVLNR
jgi:uncharacterized membrane protein